MGSGRKVASGILWSVLLNFAGALYGFISVPLLIGHFGKEQYGLLGLAASVCASLQLLDMGLSPASVKIYSGALAKGKHERLGRVFQCNLAVYGGLGIAAMIAILVIALFSERIFSVSADEHSTLRSILLVTGAFAVFTWISACLDQMVSATENVAWLRKRAFIPKLLAAIALVATLALNLGIVTFSLLCSATILAILPLTIGKIRKEAPSVSFVPRWHAPTLRAIMPYAIGIFSLGISQMAFVHFRPLALGMRGNAANVADYMVMAGIAGLCTMVGSTFMAALLPSSSKVVALGDKDAFDRIAYRGTKYASAAYCFCAFGLMAIIDDLICAYVGEAFLCLAPWLCLWLFLSIGGHNHCISSLILAGDQLRPIAIASVVSATLGIVATWALAPRLGAGAPVAGIAAYTFSQQTFFYCYYWPKVMGIDSWRVFAESLLPFIAIGAAVCVALRSFPHLTNHWINICIFGASFALAYSAFCWLVFDAEDRKFIKSLLCRFNLL